MAPRPWAGDPDHPASPAPSGWAAPGGPMPGGSAQPLPGQPPGPLSPHGPPPAAPMFAASPSGSSPYGPPPVGPQHPGFGAGPVGVLPPMPAPRLYTIQTAVVACSLALLVARWLLPIMMVVNRLAGGASTGLGILTGLVAALDAGCLLAAWVCTSIWLTRASTAARSVDPRAVAYGPWLAWAGWVLPIAALFLPVMVVRDAWAVGARGRPRYLQPVVRGWWAQWLIGNGLYGVGVYLLGASPQVGTVTVTVVVIGLLVLSLAARRWLAVVDGLTEAWERPRNVWSDDRTPAAPRIGIHTGQGWPQ